MNRLAPMIHRRPRRAAAFPLPASCPVAEGVETPGWVRDAKLFATGYVGGIVVFTTFLA